MKKLSEINKSYLIKVNWCLLSYSLLTSSEKCKSPIPIGIKAIPITKNVGKTVPAVSTGCQAGNLCCLKAESKEIDFQEKKGYSLFALMSNRFTLKVAQHNNLTYQKVASISRLPQLPRFERALRRPLIMLIKIYIFGNNFN